MTASAGGPPALVVNHLSKTFQSRQVLRAVDLTVAGGEVHALLGENGSGKSTLIKILSGFHEPDPGGTIAIGGEVLAPGSPDESARLGCRFVHQDLGLVDSLSVLDNLAMGAGYPRRFGTIRARTARALAAEELARVGLEVDVRALVGTLAPSVRTGIAVARALRSSDAVPIRLLVFDEPTATMPTDEVTRLHATIRATAALGVAVIYVTHRLDEVLGLADRITVLRDGRVSARRAAAGLGHADLVTLLVGGELEEVRRESAALVRGDADALLTVSHLSTGGVRDLSFTVGQGDIVGVAGLTGSGRETLLAALFGGAPRWGGAVEVDGRALPAAQPAAAIGRGVAYLPADRIGRGAAMRLSARENLTLADLGPVWAWPVLRGRRERAEAERWFQDLHVVPADGLDKPLESFSGGNQQKILFAKWLRTEPRVLLLDEPTQGVDLVTRAELHQRILHAAAAGMTVLISSADLDELTALCRRVLVLHDGGLVADLAGESLTVDALTRAALGGPLEAAA